VSLGRALARAVGAPAGAKGVGAGPNLSDWPWSLTPPESFLLGGAGGTIEQAVGLPAWLSVIRRLAHGAGITPLIVYRGPREDRERDPKAWQWDLLHKSPGAGRTPFNLTADYASCFAATGNAYLRKIKVGAGRRPRVAELMVLDPRWVRPRRRGGVLEYEDTTGGTRVIRSAEEIIHVRDMQFGDSGQDLDLEGVSPIGSLRVAVMTGARRQNWEQNYFANDARPGVALKFPLDLSREQAEEMLEFWNLHHRGPENAGRAAAIGGGGDIVSIPPISLVDAQFVESARLNLQTIAGLYGVPPSLCGDTSEGGPVGEDAQLQFATFGLSPMLVPLEQALTADPDLFPPGEELFVEALTDAVVRPNLKARYDAYRQARQGGWFTANEIRQRENQPPHPDGDVLQVTPVGGEGNPDAPAPDTDTGDPAEPNDPAAGEEAS